MYHEAWLHNAKTLTQSVDEKLNCWCVDSDCLRWDKEQWTTPFGKVTTSLQKCFVRTNYLVLNFRSICGLNTVDGRSNVESRYSTLLSSVIYISGLAFSNLRTINPPRESCIESFDGFFDTEEVFMLLLWLQINPDEDAQYPSLAM